MQEKSPPIQAGEEKVYFCLNTFLISNSKMIMGQFNVKFYSTNTRKFSNFEEAHKGRL